MRTVLQHKRVKKVLLYALLIASLIIFTVWLAGRFASLTIDWSFAIPTATMIGGAIPAAWSVINWLNEKVEEKNEKLKNEIEEKENEIEQLKTEQQILSEQIVGLREEVKVFRRILYKIEARLEVKGEHLFGEITNLKEVMSKVAIQEK